MLHPLRGLPRSSIWLVVSKSGLSSMLGLGRCVDDVVGLRGRTTWLDGYIWKALVFPTVYPRLAFGCEIHVGNGNRVGK